VVAVMALEKLAAAVRRPVASEVRVVASRVG